MRRKFIKHMKWYTEVSSLRSTTECTFSTFFFVHITLLYKKDITGSMHFSGKPNSSFIYMHYRSHLLCLQRQRTTINIRDRRPYLLHRNVHVTQTLV